MLLFNFRFSFKEETHWIKFTNLWKYFAQPKKYIYDSVYLLEYLNRITYKNAWFLTAGQGILEMLGSYPSLRVTSSGQSCNFFHTKTNPPKYLKLDQK